MSKVLSQLIAVIGLIAVWSYVAQSQGCDNNCASGCSSAGDGRCDELCYGGFHLAHNNTCIPLENLARGKPAFHISSWFTYHASLAVDGNANTHFDSGFCSHTGADANPWWAVDLGQRYSIIGVNFTNRGDCCAGRANKFIVGLTNTQPQPSQAIPLFNYTVCGQYPGPVPAGATVYQSCQHDIMPYRYVIIQTDTAVVGPGYLTICEAEVYGIACDPHCHPDVGCSVNGKASCDGNCTTGFGLTPSHKCQPCDPNCASVECSEMGGSKCDGACKHGFASTENHTCASCDTQCAVGCTKEGWGKCDGPCNFGYGATIEKTCSACDPQCATGCRITGGGKCDGSCKTGFGITKMDTCATCDAHCNPNVGCHVRGGTYCDGNCTSGYGPSSSYNCHPCDPNCAVGCNEMGAAKCDGTCQLGFGFTADNNCAPCDPNCAVGCNELGGTKCDGVCQVGFGITANHTCAKCDAHCDASSGCHKSGGGYCDWKCSDGFELSCSHRCQSTITTTVTIAQYAYNDGTRLLTKNKELILIVISGSLLIVYVATVILLCIHYKRQLREVTKNAISDTRDDDDDENQESQRVRFQELLHKSAADTDHYDHINRYSCLSTSREVDS